MKLKTVAVHYGRKANLGDFNSANIECDLWADLDEDEDVADVMGALWTMAKANVKAQLLPLVTKQQARVEEIFLGLPVELTEKESDNADQGTN
jgi:hypothetical protein